MGERHAHLQGLLRHSPTGGAPRGQRADHSEAGVRRAPHSGVGRCGGRCAQTASRGQSVHRGAGLGPQETRLCCQQRSSGPRGAAWAGRRLILLPRGSVYTANRLALLSSSEES